MKFHVLGLPHTQTTWAFAACAYTAKIINFCRMMTERGHEVVLYSGEENEALCTEHVVCIDEASRRRAVGQGHFTSAPFNATKQHWQLFNTNCIREIRKRATPEDFLCIIAGHTQKSVADALPHLMAVEWGVGYSGTFTNFRIFESYAWMHMHYGAEAQRVNGDVAGAGGDGKFFDAVVPGYIDPQMFPQGSGDGDYALFVGRMIGRKGLNVAIEACRRAKIRLIAAGPGTPPSGVEYAGILNPEDRAGIMGTARLLFVPTLYVEPFGNVAVEAQACGTPVISTDWGAFTETVIDGVTGYRCRTLSEFASAIADAQHLNRENIRALALSRYSLDVNGAKFERHFQRLATLRGSGWYAQAA